ncbi:MAG: flagellar biosynthetic protein FliO [Thermoguttaceae bacterium]|nr:flagellar biosynthetic protein FliO [Thermoguttaceae bacterium]
MREIKRKKRSAARWAVVAIVVLTATSGGTVVGNESARGGGFLPRLGTNAVEPSERDEKVGFAGFATEAKSGARSGRVKSADFVGFAGKEDFAEREKTALGGTRLVGWTASDAGTGDSNGAAEIEAETAPNGGSTVTKTPILRDETAANPADGGSFFGALVSTIGSLAVVLGVFFALVALWKRTAPKSGNGAGAAEVLDSTPLGDRARLLTIRWGNRLILAARTPEKIAPLAEIAEPVEVAEALAEIERRKNAASSGFSGRGAVDFLTAFGAKGRKR